MNLFHVVLVLSLSVLRVSGQQPLELVRTIALEGVKGRFDHCAMDPKGGRLFVAALGNNTLEVIDVAAGKRLQPIPGLRKPTGVAYLADLNQIGVANGDDGTFKVFDGASHKRLANIGKLDDADNVRQDARTGIVYVGYGDGAIAGLDPITWKVLGTTRLSGHPESFQLDPSGPNIYVNVPDAKQIAVVDRTQNKVITTWPMSEFQANFPMALDAASHRLFIGCRKPARLLIFDTSSGRSMGSLAISGDTDDLFYDGKTGQVYISCGEGFINVIARQGRDEYKLASKIPTRTGARTSFFSGERGEFYVLVPERRGSSAELRIYKVQE